MAARRTRAQLRPSQSKAATTATVPVESPTTESLSENQQAPSSIVVCPPSGDAPSKDQPTPENLRVIPTAGEAPSKAPLVKEPLTTLPHLGSPSKGQPTTEAQAADQQTTEGPTTNQQAEKALEDTPASAILPNGRSATDGPTANLPDRELPKELRESSSHVQSTAERPSENHPVKSLPTRPSSGKQSGKILFRHLPRIL
jgi:hypothetical protein